MRHLKRLGYIYQQVVSKLNRATNLHKIDCQMKKIDLIIAVLFDRNGDKKQLFSSYIDDSVLQR
ncbi:hypothetical protein CW736_12050 [Nonlabens sp. MB-3u-79]|nr:hypothetical protein CW736_12050 [Nonlabens sp. MB-3u-79]